MLYSTLKDLNEKYNPVYRNRISRQQEALDYFRECCRNIPAITQEPFFVKVGANDGISADPCSDILLQDSRWKGLLIEPVQYCFEALQRNFTDENRFSFEQVAISNQACNREFFYVKAEAFNETPGFPLWLKRIGSFDRNHILKHATGNPDRGLLDKYITKSMLEVSTLHDVLVKHNIQTITLLHIDAEGHDHVILNSLDFTRYKPDMIFIEHRHMDNKNRNNLLGKLTGNQYAIHDCGYDIFAILKSTADRLVTDI